MRPDPARLFPGIDFSSRNSVLAAVSGGSDSLGLLVLLKDFLDRHHPGIRLTAVTVDHRLRPESGEEARGVGEICSRLGVEHGIRTWRDEKPSSALSAAARDARYNLLAEAAHDAGADIVFTGHTMDDQAETVGMRSARAKAGSGRGAAGMAVETLFDDRVWIVRPLLSTRRVELRELLVERGISWFDDPSNRDRKYERVRMREELEHASVEDIAGEAAAAGERRRDLGERVALLVDKYARRISPGLFRLERGFAAGDNREATRYALRILLAVTGGTEYLPDEARAAGLLDAMVGLPMRATLSRAVIDGRKDAIYLRREARGLPAREIGPAPMLWDGRYRISGSGTGADLHVAAIGNETVPDMEQMPPGVPENLARTAFSVQPGLWRGGVFLGPATAETAARHGVSAAATTGPWARFLPGFDLAAVQAARRLVGAAELPCSPLRKHIAV
ncbi:tRNA lysidine(34) synthetase TilS [Aquamicrobium sp. LC103]|uniref:tRNA lysidine(34) synthetase TilS n=1 Tax=Aquamicrobium sp. LC103 TaxID=1120658 RepID=UPI00063E71F0|nr:tRNA lysidine(34) synthetase TilS [Aquamicrobium sp. LC103]TKT75362.1 tRNA lysidine(34) synthetase TilS [Aquamicrobium sp. LC103]